MGQLFKWQSHQGETTQLKENNMGLDMYLTGEQYIPKDWENPANNQMEDGYRLKSRNFDLGYWRKHPDLHGFIVQNFAGGEDDCKSVHLDADDIVEIISAVNEDRLPKTSGFFFGESTNDIGEKLEATEIFVNALNWLLADDWRSVYYRASW